MHTGKKCCNGSWMIHKGFSNYRWCLPYVHMPVNSKTAPPPPPRAIPGHFTRVKLRTAGNLIQNEAHPVGHLTFVSKCLSIQQVSRVHGSFALVDSTWVFLLLSFYIFLSWNIPLFKVWSEDSYLNKKFVVAENFAELVSTVCFTCLEGGGFDPLWSYNRWGIWPSKLAT